MKARIITIGDEILIGQIVDTNSAWLAQQLNALGITIESIVSIADTREAIHKALYDVDRQVSIVIMTGGLGPTKDDITKSALADWFGSGWRTDDNVLARVEQHFANRGIEMPIANKEQAEVPDNCDLLINKYGTAPGMWFEKNDTIFVSMPGVPFEMKSIFSDELVPRIKNKLITQKVAHRTIHTQGIGETSLMEIITDWETRLRNKGFTLAYLPSVGAVRLRVSALNEGGGDLQPSVDEQVELLLPLISEYAFGFDGASLEETVGKLLKSHGLSVSTAESCTGGYVAHLITSVAGSSSYFHGSAITYANTAKVEVLNVNPQLIADHGAVSEEVVIQMAEGVRRLYNTEFAISTSGIAGPDGGSDEKPVGTVWIGVAGPSRSFAKRYVMGNNRERNIRKTALQSLQLLRKEILKEMNINPVESLKRDIGLLQ
ncbi:MAG: competence/damage-inducible protein A [Salibacteraceae bacterium]